MCRIYIEIRTVNSQSYTTVNAGDKNVVQRTELAKINPRWLWDMNCLDITSAVECFIRYTKIILARVCMPASTVLSPTSQPPLPLLYISFVFYFVIALAYCNFSISSGLS